MLIPLILTLMYSVTPEVFQIHAPTKDITCFGHSTRYAQTTDRVITERIDGPANIRDAVNGTLLFSLNDQVSVTCSAIEDGWYRIGILADTDMDAIGSTLLRAGSKILVDGSEVGEMKADMHVFARHTEHGIKLELTGYTYNGNIRPESIIERVLENRVETLGGNRSAPVFEAFIEQFALQQVDSFDGLVLYCNFESWLDDPSPMWRIGLVFRDDTLVAVLHSRPLHLPGTTDHTFNRGIDCLTFDDSGNTYTLVQTFREFVNSVD